MTPEQQLLARPTYEELTPGYLQMMKDLRAALTTLVPSLDWDNPAPTTDEEGCGGEFADILTAGRVKYDSSASSNIPEAV